MSKGIPKTEMVKTTLLKSNPNNPRVIRDDKFFKLVKSIKEFPEMLHLRPIVVDANMVVLGGNMRLKACTEAGMKEVPVLKAEHLTKEQQERFIIADNVSFGEWDFDTLANEWDSKELDSWGLDIAFLEGEEESDVNEIDLLKIEIPFYEPSEICPKVSDLAFLGKTKSFLDKIGQLEIEEELKVVLRARAAFFTDFNFQNIADFYVKQSKEVRTVFEDLGLVVLAPKEAIEKGFAKRQRL